MNLGKILLFRFKAPAYLGHQKYPGPATIHCSSGGMLQFLVQPLACEPPTKLIAKLSGNLVTEYAGLLGKF